MKNTQFIYGMMGVLFLVPLIAFNIKKIWVRRPPNSVKFQVGRMIFVLLVSALIVTFLSTAYQATLKNRYEIAIERIAEKHAEMAVGLISFDEFKEFVVNHGTDNVKAGLDSAEFVAARDVPSARFQLSSWCVPKYWKGVEGFEQVGVLNDENPIYLMYVLEIGSQQDYYVVRMVNTDDGWKYDWFGNANEAHRKIIKMPTLKNGKWYTVSR